ncbi:hypothetical protein HHI36_014267 [Cryptolaemus montrouzieri]|uniref:Uncharacterized protein n=1 Tax=Cryptolaemus montrouzieri TaxID=559131 RepID=A0ABD2N2P2_9CUCU
MDREELERRRIMAVLEESDSDVMPSDQESGEDDDHVSERSEATNTEQEISDDDEVPLATIRRRVQSEANLHQEYASTSLSTRDCEITRQYFEIPDFIRLSDKENEITVVNLLGMANQRGHSSTSTEFHDYSF